MMEFIVLILRNEGEYCETEETVRRFDHIHIDYLESTIKALQVQIDKPSEWIEVHLYGDK